MSEDEIFVLIVSLIISVIGWGKWYFQLLSVSNRKSSGPRLILFLAPIAAATSLYYVLTKFASFDVKDSSAYLFFYMVVGAAWTAGALHLFPFRGLSPRDDVAERGNSSAAWAIAGCLIGVTWAFAGANIGDGPGWWVVFFCAGLSTIGFFLLWTLINQFGSTIEAIVVDRDVATGIRFGGLMLSIGMILGRAAAGNWVSSAEAVEVFIKVGWPSLLLGLGGIIFERFLRPTPQHPSRAFMPFGLFPAILYVFSAAAYIFSIGKW